MASGISPETGGGVRGLIGVSFSMPGVFLSVELAEIEEVVLKKD